MAFATETAAAKVHALRMAADQAAIDAKQASLAARAAQNPSDVEYAERQALSADRRAVNARVALYRAMHRAKAVSA